MNKQDRNTWVYLVGVIIMFGLLIVIASQFVLPLFQKNKNNTLNLNPAKPELSIDINKTYIAKIVTNKGEFTVQLCASCTPQNTNNFIYLAKKEYYVNTKFHRVIKDLLIQGGDRNTLGTDLSSYGKGKTNYLLNDEVNWDSLALSKEKRDDLTQKGYSTTPNLQSKALTKYSVAMANDGPNTNSSQFFIVTADNSDSRIQDLNGYFTVIGDVTSGFDTLTKINELPIADSTSYRPTEDATIQSIEISEQ